MRIAILISLGIMLASSIACAAPGIWVGKPPVQPNSAYTGPDEDPQAILGQWFYSPTNHTTDSRPYEFHDNKFGWGGGSRIKEGLQWGSTYSIYGKVCSVGTLNDCITEFLVTAKITNDEPSLSSWYRGENSHGEWTTAPPTNPNDPNDAINNPVLEDGPDPGLLKNVRLTTEFAISDLQNLPSAWTSPYRQGEVPYVIAEDEDTLAWYCWNADSGGTPAGGYYVPAYDFYNLRATCDGGTPDLILPGETHSRTLRFRVSGNGIAPLGDPRYNVIMSSLNAPEHEGDIFSNRSTDLKIGDWVDNLRLDDGSPYPLDPIKGGNVSVFYWMPEPGSLTALAFGLIAALGLTRRRRQ